MLGEPKYVDANGLTFAYHEAGSGPLVLCMHGYPDTAQTYDALLPALADAGFRAVAPYLRGYHPTAIPADGDYSGATLGADVRALVTALGAEQACLVGHDWGAFCVYAATMQDEAAVRALVTLAIPHPRAIRPSLKAVWKARHFITYQFRRLALRQLKANDFEHIAKIYKRWAPTWTQAGPDIERAKACLRQPGVPEAALGYYWAWRAAQGDKDAQRALRRKISVPTLSIGGSADGAVAAAQYATTASCYTGPYEQHLVHGVGHFPHREAPDLVVGYIVDFLSRYGRE